MKMREDLKDEVKNSFKDIEEKQTRNQRKSINLIKNANKARN